MALRRTPRPSRIPPIVAEMQWPIMTTPYRIGLVDFLQIVDIRTKIVSVSSLLIGTDYAVHPTHALHPGLFVLMLPATLCVDMGRNGRTGIASIRGGLWSPRASPVGSEAQSLVLRGAG
jgi:hypothetical protein